MRGRAAEPETVTPFSMPRLGDREDVPVQLERVPLELGRVPLEPWPVPLQLRRIPLELWPVPLQL